MTDKLQELLPTPDIIDKYLNGISEKELLFVTGVYHEKSPYSTIEDTVKRKFAICKDLGIKNDAWCLGTDNKMNKYSLAFCRLYRSYDYSELQVYKDQFYQSLLELKGIDEQIYTDISEKDKQQSTRKKLLENIKTIKTRISELQDEFLKNDRSRQILMELMEELDDEAPYPEMIAKKLSQGQSPLGNFNPYL